MSVSFKMDADMLSEVAEAVALVASTDDSRPVLQSVCIRQTDDGTLFEVTDSYRLLRILVNTGIHPSHDPILVEAKELAEAAKRFRSSKKSDAKTPRSVTLEANNDMLHLQHEPTLIGLTQVRGEFPDTAKIVEDDPPTEWEGNIGFNPEYLSDIGKIVKKFRGSKQPRADMYGLSRTRPNYWRLANLKTVTDLPVTATYILMPVRIDN